MTPGTAADKPIDYAATLSAGAKRLILAAVLIALFLTSLDQTIVAAALPAIVADLGNLDLLAWTSTSYLLVSATTLPIFGKLSDLYGRKAVLLFGTGIFLIGSMLCGLAPTMLLLVIFRGVQGLGSGALLAMALTVPADLYAPAERARVQGLIAAVFALSSIVGPFLGGALTDTVGWHWIFYINLPLGLPVLFFIVVYMPALGGGLQRRLDLLGAGLLTLTVVPTLVAFSLDRERYPWDEPLVLGLIAIAAIGLVMFVFAEQRAGEPILPLSLFAVPTFSLMCAISVLTGGGFITSVLFLPIFLVNVLDTTATEAGLALMPVTLGLLLASVISGDVVQRTGRYKGALILGLVLFWVGFWCLSTLSVRTTLPQIWLWMAILGLGAGAVFPQLNLAIQNAVRFEYVGVATSGRLFFSQLGQTAASAVFGALLTALLTGALGSSLAPITARLPTQLAGYLDPQKLRDGGSRAATEFAALEAQISRPDASLGREIRNAFKQSFATSIASLYGYGLPFLGLAIVLGFLVPELPLKRSNLQTDIE